MTDTTQPSLEEPLITAATIKPGESLNILLHNRGALYEGEIFIALEHLFSDFVQLSFVVRSFEFSLADGALDCAQDFKSETSFVDRFFTIDQRLPSEKTSLVLFDIKSKVSGNAGDQIYSTTLKQRQQVAFYVCICAADPTYVELIPNFYQGLPIGPDEDASREISVNNSRISYLPLATYRLDPSNSPYRMTFHLLPEALRRVRRTVRGHGPYVNPGNSVRFPDWKPSSTDSNEFLKPLPSSEHFTAYRAVMQIYRAIKASSPRVPIELDFVGLQPRLADFKLVPSQEFLEQYALDTGTAFPAQVFVQHKIDARDRAAQNPLSNVAIARGEGLNRRSYFTAVDRFDYLFYQFDYQNRPYRPYTQFFFLPEYEIPDSFYTSANKEESFDLPNFKKYLIRMDDDGGWVWRMWEVVRANPLPRRAGARPIPSASTVNPRSTMPGIIDSAVPSTATLNATSTTQTIPDSATRSSDPAPLQAGNVHGRHTYSKIIATRHAQLYENIMRRCAVMRSGILVILANNHPIGDFGFASYEWTSQEQEDFMDSGILPKTVDDLPGLTPIIPICYYTRYSESTFRGPNLTAPQFRRLNSCGNHRLIIWNLWGPDETEQLCPLVVIPSEDICPTKAQRKLFAENLEVEKATEQISRQPWVSCLLNSGLFAADYVVGNRGPSVYAGNDWCEVWELFDAFATGSQLQFPEGRVRDPALYRCALRDIHERLLEEDMRDARRQQIKSSEKEGNRLREDEGDKDV